MQDASSPHLNEQTASGAKGRRTRVRILEAAEEVFGRRGFHDASISEITRLAGVAQGSFYVYFQSKTAIFDELIAARCTELHEELDRVLEGIGSEEGTRYRLGMDTALRWIGEHRWFYRVMRQAEFVNPALRERWYRAFADRYVGVLVGAMDAGAIPKGDPEVLAWCLIGMTEMIAMRWIVWSEEVPLSPDRWNAFVEVTLRALGISEPEKR
ncbi:MAG: TetR/AcrR family transcriptional regulator [Actinomycetota bacterium]